MLRDYKICASLNCTVDEIVKGKIIMKKEDVIKALEICSVEGGACEGCPYENHHYVAGCGGCTNALMRDAAELLKEGGGSDGAQV